MEECTVCCSERLTPATAVECLFCSNRTVCKTCVKRYLLDADPQCMVCHHPWSVEFLYSILPRSWLNTVFANRQYERALEFEKSVMAHTQRKVHLDRQVANLQAEKKAVKNDVKLVRKTIKELTEFRLKVHKRRLSEINLGLEELQGEPVGDRKAFVQNCGVAGCAGYLSTAWKCYACGAATCNQCHVPKQDGHACHPDAVASVQMLAAASKPCPGCRATIIKSEGCDQMWCPKCKKAFSWRTGKLVAAGAYVHNPEYLRYLRENNLPIDRAPGDAAPGQPAAPECLTIRRIETQLFDRIMRLRQANPSSELRLEWFLSRVVRSLVHHEGTAANVTAPDRSQVNAKLRTKLLNNVISQEQFDKSVRRTLKRQLVKEGIDEINGFVVQAATDILGRTLVPRMASSSEWTSDDLAQMNEELDKIRTFSNASLKELGKRHAITPRAFDDQFKIRTEPRKRKAQEAPSV